MARCAMWLLVVGCGGAATVDENTCTYDDLTYALGDTFPATDGCNTCTCEDDGAVYCTEIGCLGDSG